MTSEHNNDYYIDTSDLKGDDNSNNNHGWMMSFSDLLALILTFFILLYSMKTIPRNQWDELLKTFHAQFRLEQNASYILPPTFKGIEEIQLDNAKDTDYLYHLFKKAIGLEPKLQPFSLAKHPEGVVLSLNTEHIFSGNTAILTEEANEAISLLSNILNKLNNDILVVGHASTAPIDSKLYVNDWERSLARALSIKTALKEHAGIQHADALSVPATFETKNPTHIAKEKIDKMTRRVDIIIKELESVQTVTD